LDNKEKQGYRAHQAAKDHRALPALKDLLVSQEVAAFLVTRDFLVLKVALVR